ARRDFITLTQGGGDRRDGDAGDRGSGGSGSGAFRLLDAGPACLQLGTGGPGAGADIDRLTASIPKDFEPQGVASARLADAARQLTGRRDSLSVQGDDDVPGAKAAPVR